MRKYASVIVFIVLTASSCIASIGSYRTMEGMIVDDLNRALELTVAEKRDCWMTNDTIRAYRRLQSTMDGSIALKADNSAFRSHLTIPGLRDLSYIRLDIPSEHGNGTDATAASCSEGLSSDTIVWSSAQLDANISVRGHAGISAATVFMMSDQRLSLILCMAAMMWAAMSAALFRRERRTTHVMTAVQAQTASCTATDDRTAGNFGGLTLSADGNCFYGEAGQTVRLTPMQHRLMVMFFGSPSRCLGKQDICDALWPKKEDASDTLYTLIKRLKPVLEANTRLKIEAERGRAYRLTIAGND